MAHNTRTRVNFAAWANGTAVTQDEFDKLDGFAYSAINGDAGGTWAPAAVIAIGGAGIELVSAPLVLSGTASLSVAGATNCTGNFSATGSTNVIGNSSGDTLGVNAITTFAQLVVCSNAFVAAANSTIGTTGANTCAVNATLTVYNDCTIGEDATDDFYCNSTEHHTGPEFHEGAEEHIGTELHDGDENHNGQEWHYGAAEFAGPTNFTAAAVFNNNVDLGNAKADLIKMKGRMVLDVELVGLGIGDTRDGLCADRIVITGTPGIIGGISFTAANAVDGLVKRISYQGGTNNVLIVDAVSTLTLATLATVGDTCEICFKGGRWYKS